tara:strand:+ start:128 stop:313 length:186 start_codon:yes stop_codon:yes gene_type:complete
MINLWESLEELIYKNCNKNTLNFEEYESKYGVDLRKHLDIQGIKKCINELNKTENDNERHT